MARRRKSIVAALAALGGILLLVGVAPAPASADEYDPERAAHPVRIVAYIFHPVGVLLDALIVRPAHFIVHHEPFKTLFGHTDYGDR